MKHTSESGFTLIELLVAISILVIMLSIVFVQGNRSGSGTLLLNETYEVALLTREAQSFGVAVREETGGNFDSAYGVHFDSSNPGQVLLFNDENDTLRFESSVNDPIVQTLQLDSAHTISSICATSGVTTTCAGGGFTSLSISFIRPDPDARILDNNGVEYDSAEVTLTSQAGGSQIVEVINTGQIAVK